MLNEEFPRVSSFVVLTALQMYGNLMQILSASRKGCFLPLEIKIIQNICCVTSDEAEENSHGRKGERSENVSNKNGFIEMILFS
jgi:hypothetical protein